MKEIDVFLAAWVTPFLKAGAYRKSGHTYRKQYDSGDWAVLSFRSYPLGITGSFLVDASYVTAAHFDWFKTTHPTLAGRQPTGWWSDWGNRVAPLDDYCWRYETDGGRDDCGTQLQQRLAGVLELLDSFGKDPDRIVAFVLNPTSFDDEVLPGFGTHLMFSRSFRAAALASRGRSPELELELAAADQFPVLQLRQWADAFAASR